LNHEPARISGPSRTRRIVQVVLLGFFLLLFTFTLFPARDWLPPVDLLLRIDPLAALSSLVATRSSVYRMLSAIPLLVLTLLVGRFFCGYVCPTGTCIDLWRSHVLRRYHDALPEKNLSRWKYYLLFLLLASSVFGVSLVWIFDPLSIFIRFMTLVVYPVVAFVADGTLSFVSPAAGRLDLLSLSYLSVFKPSFQGALWALTIFGAILMLELVQRRFWCRNLCPLGAFLAIFSRFSLFRRKVSYDCTGCGECEGACPMGAISGEGKKNSPAECLECYTCASACPVNEITIGPGRSRGPYRLDVMRRRVIGSAAFGFLAASLFRVDAVRVKKWHNIIRPPGSVPEEDLLSRCYRCGECMKVCVTGGIQPAVLEAGISGLWTPVLVPRIGGCEKTCNMCGRVCPSGAIRPLDLVEKTFVRMGTASIDRSRCIAWEQQKLCLICDEICPFAAIDFRLVLDAEGESKRPFVNEEVCTGCGLCEMKCPVEGRSAILVSATGEERLLTGTYMNPSKIEARRRAIEGRTPIEQLREEERLRTGEEKLPGGFILE
jgi:polyferredoxin